MSNGLNPEELGILQFLKDYGETSKQELVATAKVMGAATKVDFGVQGGGLLAKGFVKSVSRKAPVEYTITDEGIKALADNMT
jgi:hypothetical protein